MVPVGLNAERLTIEHALYTKRRVQKCVTSKKNLKFGNCSMKPQTNEVWSMFVGAFLGNIKIYEGLQLGWDVIQKWNFE
jgi:hypothetical protein